jgi:hypothetical protein
VQLGPSHRVQHRQRLASEESLNQLTFASELDFRGLLIAATIIGAVDVLDDVTITQASAVWELHTATPGSGPAGSTPQASASVATTSRPLVNTLVLAYTAAALPTLLWFSSLAIGEVLTTETLAVEIVQTLVGSIGLVASVPLTTALAAWVVTLSGHEQPDRFDRPTRPTAERPQDMFWGRQCPGHQPGGLGPPHISPISCAMRIRVTRQNASTDHLRQNIERSRLQAEHRSLPQSPDDDPSNAIE